MQRDFISYCVACVVAVCFPFFISYFNTVLWSTFFVVGCGAFQSQAGDLHVMRCVLLVVENVFLDID
jgi:hypothetical protein